MTNVFGHHNYPSKTTRYTIKLMLMREGGQKEPKLSAPLTVCNSDSKLSYCEIKVHQFSQFKAIDKSWEDLEKLRCIMDESRERL